MWSTALVVSAAALLLGCPNYSALLPVVGKSTGSASGTSVNHFFVFPSTPSFTADRDLTCVVTIQPYFVTGGPGAIVSWRSAIKIGATQTMGPAVGPGPISLFDMPLDIVPDYNYSGTYTEVFSVPSGSQVSFGAMIDPETPGSYSVNVNAVYNCSPQHP